MFHFNVVNFVAWFLKLLFLKNINRGSANFNKHFLQDKH